MMMTRLLSACAALLTTAAALIAINGPAVASAVPPAPHAPRVIGLDQPVFLGSLTVTEKAPR